MEHAILIAIIEKLTPILEEQDLLLNVTIDDDLDSNKTLGNVGIVNQIFADLKHITKNIRKNCKYWLGFFILYILYIHFFYSFCLFLLVKKYTKWNEFE